MSELYILFLLYFIFAGISIIGLGFTGYIIEKWQGKTKPYTIPKPKPVYILGIWGLNYLIALFVEFSGHFLGIWTWDNPVYIFLHAAIWWATLLTVMDLFLTSLNKYVRYIIMLGWVLLFEYLQEALIHWVTHYKLFGTPYLTITIVMGLVCIVSFLALKILQKLRLLHHPKIS